MNFQNIKEKIKKTKQIYRFVIIALIVIAPSVLSYFEDGGVLNENLEELQQKELTVLEKLSKATKEREKLPLLEEKLSETEDLMKKASAQLPDVFFVEKILKETALVAKSAGVNLLYFSPGAEIVSDTNFKYGILNIALNIEGNFFNIMKFLDEILHLTLLIQVNEISFTLTEKKQTENLAEQNVGKATEQLQNNSTSEIYKRRLAREKSSISSLLVLQTYRGLNLEEENLLQKQEKIEKKDLKHEKSL